MVTVFLARYGTAQSPATFIYSFIRHSTSRPSGAGLGEVTQSIVFDHPRSKMMGDFAALLRISLIRHQRDDLHSAGAEKENIMGNSRGIAIDV